MKKYKINNLVIDAESPVQALKIAKMLKNNIVDAAIKDAFSAGEKVKFRGDYSGTIPGKIVKKLSEAEKKANAPGHFNPDAGDYYEIETESKNLGKQKYIVFERKIERDSAIKDAYPRRFIGQLLGPIAAKLKAKLDYEVINGVAKAYFTPTTDEDRQYSYKFAEKVDEEVKRHNFFGFGWDNGKYVAINRDGQWTNDSVKDASDASIIYDSDIEELTAEERKAIKDYKEAIANTKDPKLLKLFAHILKEEVEHLEELQNKNIEE